MPSISQAKLSELEFAVIRANEDAKSAEKRAEVAASRVHAFDAILDKVIKAADGQPLVESRTSGYPHLSYNPGYEFDPRLPRPEIEERQERQIHALNERIVALESRLAAVKAVAQFAKAHKA